MCLTNLKEIILKNLSKYFYWIQTSRHCTKGWFKLPEHHILNASAGRQMS